MDKACKGCKHFEEHKPPHVPFTCVHPALRQDCFISEAERFTPPSRDFGCTLWDGAISASDAAMQAPYNWGPEGKSEAKPFVFGRPPATPLSIPRFEIDHARFTDAAEALTLAAEKFGQAVDKLKGEEDEIRR